MTKHPFDRGPKARKTNIVRVFHRMTLVVLTLAVSSAATGLGPGSPPDCIPAISTEIQSELPPTPALFSIDSELLPLEVIGRAQHADYYLSWEKSTALPYTGIEPVGNPPAAGAELPGLPPEIQAEAADCLEYENQLLSMTAKPTAQQESSVVLFSQPIEPLILAAEPTTAEPQPVIFTTVPSSKPTTQAPPPTTRATVPTTRATVPTTRATAPPTTKPAVSATGWVWPHPAGWVISSPYGYRIHPITGVRTLHKGIDICAVAGDAIVAAGSGVVIEVTTPVPGQTYGGSGFGNYIRIRHANGNITLYAHLKSVSVRFGQSVSAGQRIGSAGSTGLSTGPHLHFELHQGGVAVNPMQLFR